MAKHGDFDRLPKDRQEALIAAGVETFGRVGYKDARTDDIAHRAGISKGLLFFYFHNKRDFYFYLIQCMRERAVAAVVGPQYWEIDDYFDLMRYCAETKMDMFAQFPYLIEFCLRAFYPQHKDVSDTAMRWMYGQVDELLEQYFYHVRTDKFRDGVTMKQVTDLLIWLADGYMHQQQSLGRAIVWDEMMVEFKLWCEMVRAWAYRPEYLG
ncbi:TetR/AcrR family transcriptional regulator [Adlercreutzia sp. ZJ141]|uniref:TetR/AcrR family transcriptional regulator n=1 Tax=Adlercreutzia sp. ZJ141 TaxID=2709406 RepID=UPI0013EAE7C3|nr:TetR/AcrR family transcriptional regulator [Adlercreutzia sp. ZJ141]